MTKKWLLTFVTFGWTSRLYINIFSAPRVFNSSNHSTKTSKSSYVLSDKRDFKNVKKSVKSAQIRKINM